MRCRAPTVVHGSLQSKMMGDAIEAALDVGASHCLNLPDEIVWQIAVDVIRTLQSNATQSIEHVLPVLGGDAGEHLTDHIGENIRHVRCGELDDLN